MKYLPLRDFDTVANALNFSTPDCHVIGGCDLYTTKAAGGDKKLYRTIEHSLESQYESLVRLSASLSPPYHGSAGSDDGRKSSADKPANHSHGGRAARTRRSRTPDIDLSRSSPFGPLSQISARRTFAYLIATLNAAHPDYDFSHLLRPADFRKERSLRGLMQRLDSTLANLRPKLAALAHSAYLAPPSAALYSRGSAGTGGAEVWSPRMWNLIDGEMDLRHCEKYSYAPDEDPFEGEEGAIWSLHFFFFNRERKRVCYLYLRGLSVISHSPVHAPVVLRRAGKSAGVSIGEGAGKRASYWLGSLAGEGEVLDAGVWGEEEDDDDEGVGMAGQDDEEEVPQMDLDELRSDLADGWYSYGDLDEEAADVLEDDDAMPMSAKWQSPPAKKSVRGVSEEVAEAMEI